MSDWVTVTVSAVALVLSGIALWSARRWRPKPLIRVESDRMKHRMHAPYLSYREILIANRGNADVLDFRVDAKWGFGDLFGCESKIGTLGPDQTVLIRFGQFLPSGEDDDYPDHHLNVFVDLEQMNTLTLTVAWRQAPDLRRVRSARIERPKG
jgi:hypothetical protein